ncbi:MAG: hypoxanthine-guanine phosphoribosyltransferase [Aquimonas sp.]|nr:hypoxanthine-guanine phosphoribosyltransferase [Aquimonas sp.]
MKNPPALAAALPQSDLLFDRPELEAAIRRIAAEIRRDYGQDARPPLFLTVMNGGMLFGALLALELGFDVEFDYLHATRYRGDTTGRGVEWLRKPAVPLLKRRVLLIDDILDEGHTLNAVIQACEAEGAADVRVAVLARKRHDRCVPGLSGDYVGLEVPDRYVFGFGMDYYEQGRNLPGIYALR